MKLATWNINSVRVRIGLLCDWLTRTQPDVLCLQETKVVDDLFPREPLVALGYHLALAGQKTYNGVAIVSREPLKDVVVEYPLAENTDQRLISGLYRGIRVYSAYFPNGRTPDSEAYRMKLRWIEGLARILRHDAPLALLGDFNVAPEPRDVFDPVEMEGQIHFTVAERERLELLRAQGLVDGFRLVRSESGLYSWWDYRQGSFRRDRGLRIDHVYLSADLAPRVREAQIDRVERTKEGCSDHAPVVVELADA